MEHENDFCGCHEFVPTEKRCRTGMSPPMISKRQLKDLP